MNMQWVDTMNIMDIDVDRESKEAKDLLIGPFTSARLKKNKFEGQGKASKLLSICSINKASTWHCWEDPIPTTDEILNRGSSIEGGDPWEGVDSKLHSKWICIKVVSEQPPTKGVKDLKREEEANYEQSSGRDLGGHSAHDNQWRYGNFSPPARSYEHNFYDCYEGNRFRTRNYYNDTSCKRVSRNDVRNGGNYVNIDERFHKRKGEYEGDCETYNYRGFYDYEAWEQKVESLFYFYSLMNAISIIANNVSYVLGIEDKGRNMEKVLDNFLKDLPISLCLNPSLKCYEVSVVELELFLASYLSHVSIYGDLCTISFEGGLSLLLRYVSKCLSSYAFLEESLWHSGSIFDLSCYDFRVMNNASIESIVVGFGLDSALFDILHDKFLGKFVENVNYFSSFLAIVMENHNDFVPLNQLMPFVNGQVEFSYN
ncbi:hypothetical protein M9H77_30148 [Catharanthus roseus]|uniref:Uncharacterized protein n=1 Tax=Catharanthus roseus TaxID=4058 RepID=A0ACB9ZWT4_CATRO|nr:hypothetical protein M9H77_30148 [Catharanthus roseus]